ncbi:hypothetical protein COS78_00010 [Candidatus Shapirobacteria bacterium CG06_land_8_20_14_3_00_40_12]|uniref:Uncharacterized protein n=2 Tax=Candidatus Shapironibacteriota TaxID=1752721 RepID=A0A2M7TSQ2_9BACT|nr:MAG: hypothetical protein COS78_00010 [Candidatus Shapirobacteria bacterium CG06_land_8_20_14_3_00_40_12]PIZ58811.1 MAG: hypothetical protein COY20_02815 [Candidatus Shapirobacteria bacterium CG_4_10_14_0_2_um_filter_40_12]
MIKKFFLFFFILTTYYLTLNSSVLAQHFSSDNYVIDWGNFNITSGNKASSNYKLSDTVGQIAPGTYQKSGVLLKSGFQYIYDTFITFAFSIDNLDINFGILTPGIASTAVNTVTISTPSGHGYQISSQESRPLSLENGITIPDTVCDSPCNESTSNVWVNSSTYGFGFNASGVGASSYFVDSTYFRQFANSSASPAETPQIFMSESSPVENRQSTITYKVNISPAQSAGTYHNYIVYTAVPKY